MTTTPNTELLPCLHCGHPAEYHDSGWGIGTHAIVCTGKFDGARLCPMMVFRQIDVSKETMFAMWNTRTPSPSASVAAGEDVQECPADCDCIHCRLEEEECCDQGDMHHG